MRLTETGIGGTQGSGRSPAGFAAAIDLGIYFIDTAESYGPEVGERLIAETLWPCLKGPPLAQTAGASGRGSLFR